MEKFELTETDFVAIDKDDYDYLNDKGANLYTENIYSDAVEYYRLAASMGSVHCISNLGYCYLYGRSIEQNTSLAIAYFKIASNGGDVDATYKLGDIYGSDKWGLKDKELSCYYYLKAGKILADDDWNNIYYLTSCEQFRDYPSLCFALAREMYLDGTLCTDLARSYIFLRQAKLGYEYALSNGNDFYLNSYNNVLDYINKEEYDSIREKIDELFKEYDKDLFNKYNVKEDE